jgi:hypothetical protein
MRHYDSSVFITATYPCVAWDIDWNVTSENAVKSHENTGYFAPRATCSPTTQPLLSPVQLLECAVAIPKPRCFFFVNEKGTLNAQQDIPNKYAQNLYIRFTKQLLV